MKKKPPFHDCENDLLFREVYDLYYRRLCFFAYQLVGDKDLAEDIAQDAFVAYWNQKSTFIDNDKVVKSYLYSTVKFISLNHLRHKKVTERYSLNSLGTHIEEEKITEKMIRAEVLNEIYQALDTLPEGCKEIFRLGYFEGFSNPKIAEVLQISINTVKTQKQRGLKMLRSILKPESFLVFLLVFS